MSRRETGGLFQDFLDKLSQCHPFARSVRLSCVSGSSSVNSTDLIGFLKL